MSEILVLLDGRGRKYAASLDGTMARVEGLGAFDSAKLRSHVGRRIDVGGRSLLVLTPSPRDLRDTMERGPQTLTPKDLAAILFESGVSSGARVVEAGSGSGALTVALAWAVRPAGRVSSYDVRAESIEMAAKNVARAGLADFVDFRQGDIRAGIAEREVDAVVLDLVDPWSAVSAAWDSLRPCGHLVAFSPNMEQVKETVAALGKRPFVEVRTVELIERELEVRPVGVRPSFAALGHTGYITSGRKVLEPL